MKKLLTPLTGMLLSAAMPAPAQTPPHPPHPTPQAAASLPEDSLYQLDSQWIDQNGQKMQWAKPPHGQARVIAMGYTTCQGICPRIVSDMQRIEDGLDPAEQKKVLFSFLSLDPEVDKVPQLKAFAKKHQLSPQWQVMSGSPDGILEMAVALGIQYSKLPNGVDYAHSFLIAIVSPDGRVLHKWTSPDEDPGKSLTTLKNLIK